MLASLSGTHPVFGQRTLSAYFMAITQSPGAEEQKHRVTWSEHNSVYKFKHNSNLSTDEVENEDLSLFAVQNESAVTHKSRRTVTL
jgi:hypothetical protein